MVVFFHLPPADKSGSYENSFSRLDRAGGGESDCMGLTRIANPIYDGAFKYLLDDNRIARLFVLVSN